MSNKAKIVNTAQKFLQKGAYDKAIRELQKLLDEDPKDVRTLLKVGDIYAKKEDRVEAIKHYRRVAEAYSEQGFFLKAVAVYKQILKHDPQHFEVTVKLAELYEHLGLLQEALGQYQMVASLHDQKGNTKEWLVVLKRMVELDPENVASRVRFAEGLSRENRTAEAVEEFSQAAAILKQQGRQSDYVKVAERLVYLAPERTDTTMELARIYLALGDARRALTKLEPCYRSDPHNVQTLVLLGRAFREAGLDAKALFIFKELGAAHATAGRLGDAKLAWQAILEIDPTDADARDRLGLAPGAPVPVSPGPAIREVNQGAPPSGPALGRVALNQVVIAPPSAAGTVDVIPARLDLAGISPPSVSPPPPAPAEPRPTNRPSAAPKKAKAKEKDQIAKLLTETDVYVKYGLRDKAIEHLRKIVELDPDSVEAFEKMRDLYLGAKDNARAADAVAFIIRALLRRGDEAQAEIARAQLRGLSPGHPMGQAGASADLSFDDDVADPAIDSIDIDVSTGDFDEDEPIAPPRESIPLEAEAIDAMDDTEALFDRASIEPTAFDDSPRHAKSIEIELQPITGSADIGDLDILASIPAPPPAAGNPFLAPVASLPDEFDHPGFDEDSGFEGIGTDVDAMRTAGLAPPAERPPPAALSSSGLSSIDASSLFELTLDTPSQAAAETRPRISADLITDLPVQPLIDPAQPLLDEPFGLGSLPPSSNPEQQFNDESDGDAELLSLLEGEDSLPDPSELADEGASPELDEDLDNVEFLLEQGLHEEARDAVLEVLRRRPLYPRAIAALDKAEIALGLRPGGDEAAGEGGLADESGPAMGGVNPPAGAIASLNASISDDLSSLGDEPMILASQAPSELATARPEAALALEDQDPIAQIERAYALREAGQHAEAIRAFEAAATVPSLAAEALEMAGHCQAALNDTLGAVTYFYRALEAGAAPDRSPRLKYEIGMACESAGDTENALAWYTAAFAEDPEQPHLRTRIQNLGADPEALLEQQIGGYAEAHNGTNGHSGEPPPEPPPPAPRKNKISYI